MREVLDAIFAHKQSLDQTEFVRWLKNPDIPPEEKFSFVPAMVFFVMGFTDILNALRTDEPKSTLDALVNEHCEEDSGHWRWYAQDIEKLRFNLATWGGDALSFFSRLWGDDTRQARDLVYTAVQYAKQERSPEMRLVIIEVMEATFGVFIDALHVSSRNWPGYSQLQFFGPNHREAEQAHVTGSWVAGGTTSEAVSNIVLSPAARGRALYIVGTLFGQFEGMFEEWLHARNSYARSTDPGPEATTAATGGGWKGAHPCLERR